MSVFRDIIDRLMTVTVRVASIRDLIAMKRKAGRPQDFDDIIQLEALEKLRDKATE